LLCQHPSKGGTDLGLRLPRFPHVAQAADKLAPGTALAGQIYFITNQDPVPFWGFMGDLLEGLGYGRPRIQLPALLILVVAMIFEYIIRPLFRPIKELSSDFTVFRIKIVTCVRNFSYEKARRELGYVPAVSMAEGVRRTVVHFQHLKNSDTSKSKIQ